MKKLLLTLLAAALAMPSASGEEPLRPLSEWDFTAYCTYTRDHPIRYVRADNNWELLQVLRTPRTERELTAKGIACTRSQLLLLRETGMLRIDRDKRWRTAIPILDSMQTVALREAADRTARAMFDELEAEMRDFAALLDRRGFRENAYPILFSHVLDGKIWSEFERLKAVEPLDYTAGWSGCLWFCYPKNEAFCPGTNQLSLDDEHILHVAWSDNDPDFVGRIYAQEVLDALADALAGRTPRAEGAAIARELGVLEGDRPTLPAVDEDEALTRAIDRLTTDTAASFLRHADPAVARITGIDDASSRTIVYYHDVMWSLARLLLEGGVVRLPLLFAHPAQAQPHDTAALCFITRNNH